MPRYAVSHIDFYNYELTTEIVEAPDMFEAIKRSPKAFERVGHVFSETDNPFHTELDPGKRLDILKQEAFYTDGMINVIEIPNK